MDALTAIDTDSVDQMTDGYCSIAYDQEPMETGNRRRGGDQLTSFRASDNALTRLSVSRFSEINGGASWMVSPPYRT